MERSQAFLATFMVCVLVVNAALYFRMQSFEGIRSDIKSIREEIINIESDLEQLREDVSKLKRLGRPELVVVRIDDIQDQKNHEAQLLLLQYNYANGIPTAMGVITSTFGQDTELVKVVSMAVRGGADVMVHGWEHEDMAKVPMEGQERMLEMARNRLREVINVNASILSPPEFSFNNDTLHAMRTTGFNLISSGINFSAPGRVSNGIINVPATVYFSMVANGTWQMKSVDAICGEVMMSIARYGYAVILTHPQEYIKNGKLDQDALLVYQLVLSRVQESYSFTSMRSLRDLIAAAK